MAPNPPAVAPGAARSSRPGPGRPRKGEKEERAQAVLRVAFDLFLENGFDDTTVADILRAAGIAKRTLLQQFGGKADLFRAAMERAVAEWVIPHEVLRQAETDDREETLFRVAEMLTLNASSPAGLQLLRITNAESFRHPEAGTYAIEAGTRHGVEYLADLFRRRFSEGTGFPDAEAYAASLLSLLVIPARKLAWGASVDIEDARAHARHSVNLFLHGMLARNGVAAPIPNGDDSPHQPPA